MKKLFIILAAAMMAIGVMAEDSIRAKVNFKLYPTQNTNIFLLLDTRNGKIWMEQWSIENDKRIEAILSTYSRVTSWNEEIPGRFELYPTANLYNFIMVDQITGNTWQVQWSIDPDNRIVLPISMFPKVL